VPVIVTLEEPADAVPPAVIVNIVVPTELVGLKEAVTPDGKPPAAKATVPVKPLSRDTVTAELALEPATTLRLAGAAARLKSAIAVTVRPTAAV